MPDKRIKFSCYHSDCSQDPPTEIVLQVSSRIGSSGGEAQRLVYCDRNHQNILDLPSEYGAGDLILGGEDAPDGSRGGSVLRGRRP